jgi:hypothetical protein
MSEVKITAGNGIDMGPATERLTLPSNNGERNSRGIMYQRVILGGKLMGIALSVVGISGCPQPLLPASAFSSADKDTSSDSNGIGNDIDGPDGGGTDATSDTIGNDTVGTDADDTTDGGTDDGDGTILDVDDATDGGTDDGDGTIVEVEDATDGNDGVDGDGLDAADLDGDGTADGSSDVGPEAEVSNADADTTDIQAPKTCDGQPVGTIDTFYSGPEGTLGKGVCATGIKQCTVDGTWGVLKQETTPKTEVCDGNDNDCNGVKDDEKFSYSGPFGTEGVGVCQPKIEKCLVNQYGIFQDEIVPSEEECDGKDNNCNGKTDEGFDKKTYSGPLGTEGVGICLAETKGCIGGVIKTTQLQVLPDWEKCDGKDNDCNGKTDEGFDEKAYSGPLGTEGIGICLAETKDCIGGVVKVTQLQVLPEGEVCGNGKDDNCNGVTDEAPCDCDPDKDGIITDQFKDPKFLAALRESLKKGPNDPITLSDAQAITTVSAAVKGIEDIAGAECLQNTTTVFLQYNNLKVKGVPQLEWLPKMLNVNLSHNGLTGVAPLVKNVNFGKGATAHVIVENEIPVGEVESMKAKGVNVF